MSRKATRVIIDGKAVFHDQEGIIARVINNEMGLFDSAGVMIGLIQLTGKDVLLLTNAEFRDSKELVWMTSKDAAEFKAKKEEDSIMLATFENMDGEEVQVKRHAILGVKVGDSVYNGDVMHIVKRIISVEVTE